MEQGGVLTWRELERRIDAVEPVDVVILLDVGTILRTEPAVTRAQDDALTGLLNRRGLERAMDAVHEPFAVALLDLDDFKVINAAAGLAAGDAALVALAGLLRDRRSRDLACRWGGEEFLLVLPGETASGAADRAARLLERFRTRVRIAGLSLSFSCGVAAAPAGTDVAAAVGAATTALRRAKANGKAQVQIAPALPG